MTQQPPHRFSEAQAALSVSENQAGPIGRSELVRTHTGKENIRVGRSYKLLDMETRSVKKTNYLTILTYWLELSVSA